MVIIKDSGRGGEEVDMKEVVDLNPIWGNHFSSAPSSIANCYRLVLHN